MLEFEVTTGARVWINVSRVDAVLADGPETTKIFIGGSDEPFTVVGAAHHLADKIESVLVGML